jgi:ketol-acid reductoisomerase
MLRVCRAGMLILPVFQTTSELTFPQDETGEAWPITLALASGIGALKSGAIESSAREETLMDLFAEQALWPSVIASFREAYSTLKGLGCSDEALTHELWLSKEPAEVFERCANEGFVSQLVHHSTVSQYGQLKGSMEVDVTGVKKEFSRVAEERILGGSFAKEFSALDKDGEGG